MKDKIEQYIKAIKAAEEASLSANKNEDGGTCNIDTVIINFKGWRQANIDQVIKSSGINISSPLSGLYKGYRFVNFSANGQGNNRSRMVIAAKRKLVEMDIPATVYHQMD
ncbi:hypothetical protein [Chitinophaga varians]|uniref:hypothetical protein n=1 Tax=Chitinophaga varians TaxID=2202339 RepID=UPI00165F958C|nr:hypothetical protein [Chitinophaga varians]MBC9913161.1 hypothetical protein [Chitinophaga varians]